MAEIEGYEGPRRWHAGRPEKYPYAEWLDGTSHYLRAGRDYGMLLTTDALVRAVRAAAAKRGLRVSARKHSLSSVEITAYRPGDEETASL